MTRIRPLGLLLLLLLVLAAPFSGQEGGAQQAEPAPAEARPTDLDQVASQLEALSQDTALDDATKERVTGLLVQARAALGQAQDWDKKRVDYEAQIKTAPTEMARLKGILSEERPPFALGDDAKLPLSDAENRLRQARAELDGVQREVADLDREPQRRAERRAAIPTRIGEIQQELQQLSEQAKAAPPPSLGARELEATRTLQEARRRQLDAERSALDAELRSYEARSELLPLRREDATRRLAHVQQVATAWQNRVEELRSREAARAKREAEAIQEQVASVHPALREESERYADLARRQQRISADLASEASAEASVKTELDRVRTAYSDAKRRVEVAGSTDAVGFLLRRQKNLLPRPSDLRKRAAARRKELGELQLERLDLEAIRDELAHEDALVSGILGHLEPDTPADVRASVETQAHALVHKESTQVTRLLQDCETLFVLLLNLDEIERNLLQVTTEFGQFIDERVLWIRSCPPLWAADFRNGIAALAWLTSATSWLETGRYLSGDAAGSWPIWAVCLLPVAALFLLRRSIARGLDVQGARACKRSCVTIRPTAMALLYTVLAALPLPALLAFLGVRLSMPLDVPDFAKAIGMGLRQASIVLLLLEFVRHFLRGGGLAEAHLGWNPTQIARIRLSLLGLAAVLVPAHFLAVTLNAQPSEPLSQSVGRAAELVGLAVLALFLKRALGPSETRAARGVDGRWRPLIYRAGILTASALFVLGVIGYYFTVLELVESLIETFALAVVMTLVHDLAVRWLVVVHRRIARERAIQKLRESQKEADSEIPLEPEQIDLEQASSQSTQLVRNVVLLAVLIGLWFVWVDVLPALAVFDNIHLWSITETVMKPDAGQPMTTEVPITLGDLFLALLVLGATLLVARNVTGVLEVSVLGRLPIAPGERYAIVALIRYAVLLAGIVSAFGAIGIGWAKIQWLAAAVSVGLGFGLQEIFANFVSGIILLFERPVRVGDFVTVGETDGRVTRIRMRATTITDWDLRELIVPNKEFITNRLVNWTLSNPITRVVLPIGIAYGSDTEKARSILAEIARKNTLVMRDPSPSVVFVGFGDSALDIHLRVFLENRDYWPELVTTLNTAIHQRFAEAGIEIAFPQRDLHLRSIGPLEKILAQTPGFSVEQVSGPR